MDAKGNIPFYVHTHKNIDTGLASGDLWNESGIGTIAVDYNLSTATPTDADIRPCNIRLLPLIAF